jgi:hypothetical protein
MLLLERIKMISGDHHFSSVMAGNPVSIATTIAVDITGNVSPRLRGYRA